MTEIAKLKTAKYRYTMLVGQSGSDRDWAQVRFGTYERYVRVYSLPGINSVLIINALTPRRCVLCQQMDMNSDRSSAAASSSAPEPPKRRAGSSAEATRHHPARLGPTSAARAVRLAKEQLARDEFHSRGAAALHFVRGALLLER